MRLNSQDIYLDTLTREDCKTLWNEFEFDFENPAEELNLGHSDEKADLWFDEIQKLQGNRQLSSCYNMGLSLWEWSASMPIPLTSILERKNPWRNAAFNWRGSSENPSIGMVKSIIDCCMPY